MFTVSTGLSLHPKNILQSFNEENVKKAILKLVGTFSEEPHLIISLESWGLELELPEKPLNVKACLAIFSSLYGLHVVSLVSDTSNEQELWSFTSQLAIRLKKVETNYHKIN